MKKLSIITIVKWVLLSAIVLIIGINFVSQKENLTIDELYTYGLSNNSFQLNIEDFKDYSGKDIFLNYVAVKEGKEFDIGTVLFNQTMDTHPPIYYMIVNFICSLNPGSFSMWYGLIINVILLIALFWEMRYLFTIIIEDKVSSTILTLLSFFTYGFTNEIGFTRMYVLLSTISLAFVILIINKIKNIETESINSIKKSHAFFLIKFYIICVLGTLTQYHFTFIAAFFSIAFAVILIRKKELKLLILTIIAGVLSLATCYMLFPAILSHIASGDSLHSLVNTEKVSILDNFLELAITLRRSFFGNGIYVYLILFVLLIIINILIYKKEMLKKLFNLDTNINSNIKNQNKIRLLTYIYFLLCCIYYYTIISITTKFAFERYLYNIYPLLTIVILIPIYILLKNIKNPLKYLTIAMLFVFCFTSNLEKSPTNLGIGDSLFEEYLYQNKKTKTILFYHSVDKNGNKNSMSGTSKWKLPYPLYLFRHMENMTFVDTGYRDKLLKSTSDAISGYDDIILVIYNTQNDNDLINLLKEKNNVNNVQKLYFTSYIHVYRIN